MEKLKEEVLKQWEDVIDPKLHDAYFDEVQKQIGMYNLKNPEACILKPDKYPKYAGKTIRPAEEYKWDLYLAGPMSGLPDFNYPTFNRIAAKLRNEGYTVFNPAESDGGSTDRPRAEYMRTDISALLQCHRLVAIEGWEHSRGATTEVLIAQELGMSRATVNAEGEYLLDIEVPEVDVNAETVAPAPAKESILDEAKRLVHGDRGGSYGHPAEDFNRTANMLSALDFSRNDDCIQPEDIPIIMICVKLSRLANSYKRDNPVDIAGYAETLAMVMDY